MLKKSHFGNEISLRLENEYTIDIYCLLVCDGIQLLNKINCISSCITNIIRSDDAIASVNMLTGFSGKGDFRVTSNNPWWIKYVLDPNVMAVGYKLRRKQLINDVFFQIYLKHYVWSYRGHLLRIVVL